MKDQDARTEHPAYAKPATHTPGPWSVDRYGGDWQVCTGPTLIADLIKDEPDARLIAAAPELLEAAIVTRKFLVNSRFKPSLVATLDAAIKKATE